MSKNDDGYKTLFTCFAVVLLVPILVVYGYFANGYVLSHLWEWFVVTTFHLQPLTIVQAIGIAIVVGFLTGNRTPSNNNKEKKAFDIISEFFVALAAPWVTLLVGWIIYSTWMMPK